MIIDIVEKVKRLNTGFYNSEYQAMLEIKELVDQHDVDYLEPAHSGKPSSNDGDDPFDKIIGFRAFLII